MVEVRLRELADRELDSLNEFLARTDACETAEATFNLLRESARPVDGHPDFFDALRMDLRKEADQAAEGVKSTEEGRALIRAVCLLTWADELADDGYRDPRLAAPAG